MAVKHAPRDDGAGSIELIALGFCAAVVVLLAIPLLEVVFSSDSVAPVSSPPGQVSSAQ